MLGFVSDSSVRMLTWSTSCRDWPLRNADRPGSLRQGGPLLCSVLFPNSGGNWENPSLQTQHPFPAPAGSSTGTTRGPAPSRFHGIPAKRRPACWARGPPSSAPGQRPLVWDSAGPTGEQEGRTRGPGDSGAAPRDPARRLPTGEGPKLSPNDKAWLLGIRVQGDPHGF